MTMIDASLLETPEVPEIRPLDPTSETLKAFRVRRDFLKKNPPFPSIADSSGGPAFIASCQAAKDARRKLQEANWKLEQLQKQPGKDDTHAKARVETCQQAFDREMDECERCAGVVLDDDPEFVQLLSHQHNKMITRLVQYTIFTQAMPATLAAWCDTYEHPDDTTTDRVTTMLAEDLKMGLTQDEAHDQVKALQTCLESGGARKGQYGRALQIYRTLLTQPCTKQNPVMERLALAVALELAEPYDLFDECGKTHAYRRFDHYATAYANGELDPVMSRFNVWELRHVVDSDAPDESLCWGRESLRNYRPDIVASDDTHWRFCQIVRTDVAYGAPKWYKKPRSYDQILSGGGKCGPRAWYGRFICKAFGIPTWGCKQPGHAAMGRWTYNGWKPCLGGGLHKSWWEGQSGNDFLLETQARNACASEAEYATKVDRLEWVAQCNDEKRQPVKRDDTPDPATPWYTLSMMQRRRLAKTAKDFKPSFGEKLYDNAVPNKVRAMIKTPAVKHEDIQTLNDGTMIIPAASCVEKKDCNVMKHYNDMECCRQVWLHGNGHLVYKLDGGLSSSSSYELTLTVCTVHRQTETLICKNGSKVEIPYTMGYWRETAPIAVELSNGTLRLERVKTSFGISIKELRLVPIGQ